MNYKKFQGKCKTRPVNFDSSPEREFSDYQREVAEQSPESEQVVQSSEQA